MITGMEIYLVIVEDRHADVEVQPSAVTVHFDPVAGALRQQLPATGVKACLLRGGQAALLPKHVRAGQRGMAAQVHFDRRSEPAQVVAAILRDQEGRLGEVHLARHIPHPALLGSCREDTHGRRISGERPAGERIDLGDDDGHNSPV